MVKGLKEKKVVNGREVLIYGDLSKKTYKKNKRSWKKIIFANKEIWDWSEETRGLTKKEKILHFLIWSAVLLVVLYLDIFYIHGGSRGGAIILALAVYFFAGLLWSVGLWKYPSHLWTYLKSLHIKKSYHRLELWLETRTGVKFFKPGGYTNQAYIVESVLFLPIIMVLFFFLLPRNSNSLLLLTMMSVWIIYPWIVMLIRLNTFSSVGPNNSGGKGYDPLFFWMHAFIIGFCTTVASLILLSTLFKLGLISDELTYIGILLGALSETVLLFPEKIEKTFKIDLKSSYSRKVLNKFTKAYVGFLIGFVAIFELIIILLF